MIIDYCDFIITNFKILSTRRYQTRDYPRPLLTYSHKHNNIKVLKSARRPFSPLRKRWVLMRCSPVSAETKTGILLKTTNTCPSVFGGECFREAQKPRKIRGFYFFLKNELATRQIMSPFRSPFCSLARGEKY